MAHVVKDEVGDAGLTEMEITNAIDTLNSKFAPICIAFEVCEFRYIDNFQYDSLTGNEWQELQTLYHESNKINMFFAGSYDGAIPFCGYADSAGINNVDSGGIVILKNCATSLDRTIAHEMGHYFGLLNTFEGSGTELVDGSNCDTEGDLICDTPADPYVPGMPISGYVDVNQGCRFISTQTDANGAFYSPDVGNIMAFYGNCSCGFTHGQFLRMVNTYLGGPRKMW